MKETRILLLTGYLGSGKTTLLNRILTNRRGIRFAVIVNDIGEVNIDASLIQKDGIVSESNDSLVALQNGCICCTLKMDLVTQICDIIAMHKFDYIVIEASGICEPEPIARTICSIPYMEGDFCKEGTPVLDCVVTVVDALRMRDEFSSAKDLLKKKIAEDDIENLVIQQVEFCNIVLLNKASEVTAEERAVISGIIRKLQPEARIIECDWCDVDMESILDTEMFDFNSVSGSATWITCLEDRDDEEEGETEEYGIGTFVYRNRKPFDIGLFDDFVAKHWPKSVIRAKGICYFESEAQMCYLFEQAGTQVSLKSIGQWYATMPKEEFEELVKQDPSVADDWDPEYGDRIQKLVFIGQHMDREAICSALDRCITKESY